MSKKTFALIGNQNCGKTTLFNVLTGSNQYVGNWPGVTVDKVIGTSLIFQVFTHYHHIHLKKSFHVISCYQMTMM